MADCLLTIEDLKPAPYNPRMVLPEALNGLGVSLQKFGDLSGITWNRITGHLVCGHQRLAALKTLYGDALRMEDNALVTPTGERFPVRIVEFDEQTEKAANVAANNPLIAGAFTEDLEALLKELQPMPEFESLRLSDMLENLDDFVEREQGNGADTPPPEVPDNYVPVTQPGELIELGPHRLLCGDSTNHEQVESFFGEERADMVFADPPYGHNNNDGDLIHKREAALGKPGTRSSAPRPIANDSPADAARVFTAFLALSKSLLRSGGCCCCCCCGGGGPDPQFARWSLEMDAALEFKHAIVWDKGGLGMGWHYRRCYEFVLVAQKPGGKCHWFGGQSVPNVIRDVGKIIPSADQHPTEKPVALPEWFIKLHSRPNEIIWDPFVGHGTTLIAAENLGRRCYGIEIEPRYCDVTVVRYLRHVGPDKHPDLAKRYQSLLENAYQGSSTTDAIRPT